MRRWFILAVLLPFSAVALAAVVEVRRLPAGAMQPVAAKDNAGTVHLIWLQGDPASCDVWYQKLPGGETNGPAPVRVNRQPGSAIASGTIRGAQLAVGRGGRVHVAWNGSSTGVAKSDRGVPLWYAHSEVSGGGFEPQRNLLGQTRELDGGASVAADQAGNVYVVWHAMPDTGPQSEATRRVYVAHSTDDGLVFPPETAVPSTEGVCGCCRLQAVADRSGGLWVLYRAAESQAVRPMRLLGSSDRGATFTKVLNSPWSTGTCPMSSAGFAEGESGFLAAWETQGVIEVTSARNPPVPASAIHQVSESAQAKHPCLAFNAQGEVVCAWAEGTGWARGGSVAWRVLSSDGRSVGERTTATGLPVWSHPATFAKPNGDFVVLF
jgi:hypothetical protein